MARKTITKSKPATKQLVKKYQFAGANSSTYQQVANPYYISGTFSEQSAQEADRAYKEAIALGDFAAAQQIKIDADRKAREASEKAALDQVKAETKLANQQEVNASLSEGLNSGADLATSYFKQRAIDKAATNALANSAMQAGQAGVWAPVASAATPAIPASIASQAIPTTLASAPTTVTAIPTAAVNLSGVAGASSLPSMVVPAGNAVTTAVAPTVTTAGTSLLPGAVEVGSQVGQAAAAGTGTTVAAGTGAAAGSTAGTAAGTGASAAGTGASVGAGLATAGIGLGLNIGGTLLEKSGDDNDPTTFTRREKDRNLAGSAMKSAGTGVGIGAGIGSIIPGVGTVVGGAIGGLIGGGIGLIKGSKENKESKRIADEYAEEQRRLEAERAEAERKRKAELTKQKDILAQRYNQAFTGSRLMGMQTGFGYNTSTNMNMQPTSSFYAETGGLRVPGGKVVPIEGSDAVKFVGRKHSEGGIKIDPQTEVEGGETMDKVMMNGGKPNDYFFSSYLKLGGKSFARRHQEILKAGGSQKQIQDLAKKQEAVANKKGEKDRGPEQIAAYGGIHKYQIAGPKLVAGPTGKPVYKPVEAMTEEEYNAYLQGSGDEGRAIAPNLPWVKDSGEKTFDGNAKATYDFGTKPAATNNSRRPGPDSTAAEQVDSKGARTPQQSADAQSNRSAKTGTTVRDSNKANAKAPKDQTSVAPGGTTNNAGQASANAAKKATNANTTGTGSGANKTSTTNTPTSTKATPSSSRTGAAGAVDLGNQIFEFIGLPKGTSALSKDDEGGTSMSIKGVPSGQKTGKKFFGNVTDVEFAAMKTANPWYDFSNFDPSNKAQVLNFQQEYNKRVKSGEKLKEDGKFGQQTVSSRLYKDAPAAADKGAEQKIETVDPGTMGPPTPGDDYFKKAEEEKIIAKTRKGINGSLLAGLGQLIPVGYALARPYKTEGALPRMEGGGNVGAGSVRGAILPRVNMNAERAAAERNTVATTRAIQNTNAGPGGIAAMMAANSAQNTQMLTIANQEQEANKQLAAEEARLGQQASMSNAEMAQRANMANVQNRLTVNQANLDAGIQEARMKIDEKRYKREEILGALDTAASRIAGIVKDERSYKAQERLAKAIDNTGSYDRFTIFEQLQKESKRKNSPYYGKTDAELKKIAADTYNEVAGKMGLEGVETERTGGSRKYTSRLGQLSRGRKTFNI